MTLSLNRLRRSAKTLKKACKAGSPEALARVRAELPDLTEVKHADALHVVAREAGYDSWPRLKAAVEMSELDRAQQAQRLKIALYLGQHAVVDEMLRAIPDLGQDNLGLECALYDVGAVQARLRADPHAATRLVGVRSPILHLAFSCHVHGGGSEADMLAVAEALLQAGADINDSFPAEPGSEHRLSALYGAIGHADNMVLGRWLLEQGADPNDNESLYHSTELGHHDGLHMLLAHGARPQGTNALLRALDFDDIDAVKLLLEAGADPNEGTAPHPSGQPAMVIPALHQAARRHASRAVVSLLLDYGADPSHRFQGHSPYAIARVYGNRSAAEVLLGAGADPSLDETESLLARAADGLGASDDRIVTDDLPEEFRRLLTRLVWREGTLAHMQRLVAAGLDPNVTDEMGMPPLHLAGWEGLPEKMAYLMTLGPNLEHTNDYGGTLFSTILHGAENCPNRATRDHIGCMRLALEHGVPIPKRAPGEVLDEEMGALLADWAKANPAQVTEAGPF